MDSLEFRDILSIIFQKLLHNKNIYLVCKLWNRVYKYIIATKPIVVSYNKKYNIQNKVNINSLDITYSNLENLNYFTGLKYLYAYGCHALSNASINIENLIGLDIGKCNKITELPCLMDLKYLSMYRCNNIFNISILENIPNLETLNISSCRQITRLPDLRAIRILKANYCTNLNIDNLINSKNLQFLGINGCFMIINLPYFPNLKLLDASDCCELININVTNINKLMCLNISGTKVTELPNLNRCTELNIAGCDINNIHEKLEIMKYLRKLNISRCSKINYLPYLYHLESLVMDNNNITNIYDFLENTKKIKKIIMCRINITKLPKLDNLVNLHINESPISNIDDISSKLLVLNISRCDNISKLPNIKNLSRLHISNCANINTNSLKNAENLKSLDISYCTQIEEIPALNYDFLGIRGTNISPDKFKFVNVLIH